MLLAVPGGPCHAGVWRQEENEKAARERESIEIPSVFLSFFCHVVSGVIFCSSTLSRAPEGSGGGGLPLSREGSTQGKQR